MMKAVLGFCVAILVGCAAVETPLAPAGRAATLDGTVWELPNAGAGRPVTLEFRLLADGALVVGGYDGCNRYNGPAALGDGEAIRFERLTLTRMACLGNTGAIERRMQDALEATRALRVEGTALNLLGTEGQSLLTLRRQ